MNESKKGNKKHQSDTPFRQTQSNNFNTNMNKKCN